VIEFVAHLLLTAALLLLVANVVRGVEVEGWGSAFLGAIVLGLVNAFVRPVMVVLTFPLTIITFGLFLLVVNALMLWLVAPGPHAPQRGRRGARRPRLVAAMR
jgi:putative membrane protein